MLLSSGDHFSHSNHFACGNFQLYRISLLFKCRKSLPCFQWWWGCRNILFHIRACLCQYCNRTSQFIRQYPRNLYDNQHHCRIGRMCHDDRYKFHHHYYFACGNFQLYRISLLFKCDQSNTNIQWWRHRGNFFLNNRVGFCKYLNRAGQFIRKYTRNLHDNQHHRGIRRLCNGDRNKFHHHHNLTYCNNILSGVTIQHLGDNTTKCYFNRYFRWYFFSFPNRINHRSVYRRDNAKHKRRRNLYRNLHHCSVGWV